MDENVNTERLTEGQIASIEASITAILNGDVMLHEEDVECPACEIGFLYEFTPEYTRSFRELRTDAQAILAELRATQAERDEAKTNFDLLYEQYEETIVEANKLRAYVEKRQQADIDGQMHTALDAGTNAWQGSVWNRLQDLETKVNVLADRVQGVDVGLAGVDIAHKKIQAMLVEIVIGQNDDPDTYDYVETPYYEKQPKQDWGAQRYGVQDYREEGYKLWQTGETLEGVRYLMRRPR